MVERRAKFVVDDPLNRALVFIERVTAHLSSLQNSGSREHTEPHQRHVFIIAPVRMAMASTFMDSRNCPEPSRHHDDDGGKEREVCNHTTRRLFISGMAGAPPRGHSLLEPNLSELNYVVSSPEQIGMETYDQETKRAYLGLMRRPRLVILESRVME